jgi:Zn-dependent protease
MRRETATFRPAPGPIRGPLLFGAAGGAALGVLLGLPPPDVALFAGFGGVAAWISVASRQAAGLRAVADEWGLRVLGSREDPAAGLAARWADLRLGFGFAGRDSGSVQRYAILADPRGRSFAFADLAGQAGCGAAIGADGRPVPVADLREATLLLALVVQRIPAWYVLPEALAAPPIAQPAAAPPAGDAADVPVPATRRERGGRIGLLGLVGKLGAKVAGSLGKVGATALKAAKTTNLGWAAASAATYSVLFSWKFALAIMLQLFVHEYGHVHAMRKTGMKVRGMYFIPFLGALAVTEDQFTSRRQQAYVALNGPIWGSVFSLLPAALYLWTGEPAWAAVAAWWALINLFNLLPIAPLDGGRVMQAFALSYSSTLGLAVSVAGLVGAVALGSILGFGLIWLLAALGAMELVAEAQARAGVRALRLLPEAGRFGPPQWLWLRAVLGPQPGGPDEQLFLRGLERSERAARAEPMSPGEMARWGLAYAGLAAALVLIIWLVRHVPGASVAAGILE